MCSDMPDFITPMDCSLPGSSIHRASQARMLEYVPFSPPGDLPDTGITPESPVSLELLANSLPTKPPRKPYIIGTLGEQGMIVYGIPGRMGEGTNGSALSSHLVIQRDSNVALGLTSIYLTQIFHSCQEDTQK